VTFHSRALDKYGRPLGAIRMDGRDYGADMIEAGHAIRYFGE
jgi:endonuclease YncB( thermonuclease family)